MGREAVFPDAVGLGRNVGHGAFGLDLAPYRIAVIAFVAMQDAAFWQALEKLHSCFAISNLTTREQEGDGTAQAICQCMDFGGATAARASDGLILLPPLPPAAQRCALTAEESMRTSTSGPSEAERAWNKFIQTPLAAQRT